MPVGRSPDARVVLALDFVARVEQVLGQLAIIGQDQQAFRFEIEPPDRVDVPADALQQIHHRGTMLGIGSRRDVASRLVQQDVTLVSDWPDARTVDPDVVVIGVGLLTKFSNGPAVHRDPALFDERLRRAPRGNARHREDLLEPYARGRWCLRWRGVTSDVLVVRWIA